MLNFDSLSAPNIGEQFYYVMSVALHGAGPPRCSSGAASCSGGLTQSDVTKGVYHSRPKSFSVLLSCSLIHPCSAAASRYILVGCQQELSADVIGLPYAIPD